MSFGRSELFRPRLVSFFEIGASKLPPDILQGSGSVLNPRDAESVCLMTDESGVTTYRVQVRRKDRGENVFFVDYAGDQEVGYVRTDHDEEISFARNIHTKDGFGQRGLGARRLIMANQYAVAKYERPLYSGLATLPEGRRLWKSLISKGLVEATGNLFNHMYRFIE